LLILWNLCSFERTLLTNLYTNTKKGKLPVLTSEAASLVIGLRNTLITCLTTQLLLIAEYCYVLSCRPLLAIIPKSPPRSNT